MMPFHSWSVPGRKPGTSTNVRTGTLNASQVRTKRAAFSEASMSRQPADWRVWDERVQLAVGLRDIVEEPARRLGRLEHRRLGKIVAGQEGQQFLDVRN